MEILRPIKKIFWRDIIHKQKIDNFLCFVTLNTKESYYVAKQSISCSDGSQGQRGDQQWHDDGHQALGDASKGEASESQSVGGLTETPHMTIVHFC